MLQRLKFYLIRIIFFLSIVIIGLMVTGAVHRDYNVLQKDASINIGNEEFSITRAAEEYQPKVFVNKEVDASELTAIRYELIDFNDEIVINYFYEWAKETNPNFISDLAQKIWSIIYFRFSISDIEFIQLNIDKKTGKINKSSLNNQLVSSSEDNCFEVLNWKHEFSFCNGKSGLKLAESTLVFFEDSDYASLKIARRSQGDFRTDDNVMNIPFIIFLALLATYYFRHIQKDYNNEYPEH